jgi:type IV pilus assembly protein PilY1
MKLFISTTLVLVVVSLFSSQSFAALSAPTAAAATEITTTTFKANWSAVAGATAYYLDVGTTSGGTQVLNNLNEGNTTSVTVLGTPGTTYYYRVRAWNASSTSGNSAVITVVTIPNAPTIDNPIPPVTAPYDTQFTAKWIVPVGGTAVTGYYLDVATDSSFATMVAGYNPKTIAGRATITSVVTGLTGGTHYFCRVRAYNASGTSQYSNWRDIYTFPTAPVATAATDKTSSGFTANWNASPGAINYLLDVGTTSGGTDVLPNQPVGNVTSYAVTGLLGGKTYYYRLRAVGTQGTNPTYSNIISVLTVPATPSIGGRTTSTGTSVTITWTASTGATGYYIDVATDSDFTTMFLTNQSVGNVTSYNLTGVTPGTDYYYRVRAANASGTSSDSTASYIDFTAPSVVGVTAGTSSADSAPVDLTLITLGGPYVRTTTPFITVKFSEPVLGVQYSSANNGIVLRNSAATPVIQTLATPYDPENNTTATTAGNPSSATFQAASPLVNSMKYKITITGGVSATTIHDALSATAVNNNALISPPIYYFTVDTTNPTVATVAPVNGATGVSISQAINVVFTENCVMNNTTYNSTNIQLTNSDGVVIGTAISSSASPFTTLTITPAASLEYNTTYTLTLSNIKDAAGNLLGGTGTYTTSFTTRMMSSTSYSMVPSFLSAPVTPNVLIILDNSNSMDETLTTGDAIGSFNCTDPNDMNTCSRSVLARRALIDLVNTYAGKINIGLMAYNLPSGTSKSYYLYNNFYFASYDQRKYCGINPPPTACYNYCVTENSSDETDCNNACQSGTPSNGEVFLDKGYTFNANFQANLREPIITNVTNGSTANSDKRKRYCGTIYPKTASHFDAANSVTVYYGVPGTLYSGSSGEGTRFLYSGNPPGSSNYTPSDTSSNTYYLYQNKAVPGVPPYDGYVGYSNLDTSHSYVATDDDKALGFYNFGQASMYYPPNNGAASKTWFANAAASPAGGFLHVPATINLGDNVQLNKLLAKIGTGGFKNNETGYMACTSTGSAANRCSYIVNAGVTPTAGTLQSAIDYLNGSLAAAQTQDNAVPATPIEYSCQKTFIIYVTDGLPSVDAAGAAKDGSNNLYTASTLTNMTGGVLDKLKKLRCPTGATAANCGVSKTIGGTNVTFDVQTYVLGLAISPQSSSLLDSMAVTGGTAKNGKAFYANDATSLNNALVYIFQNILAQLSAGTAASILNNSEGSGANMLQAVFYPNKTFDANSQCGWVGEMQNLWYFLDPNLQKTSIREDSDENNVMNLKNDKVAQFYFDISQNKTLVNLYSDANGDGAADTPSTADSTIDPDKVKSLWKAGMLLWKRDVSTYPRTIYTGYSSTAGNTPQLLMSSLFDTDAKLDLLQIPATLTLAQRSAKAETLLNWVHGFDQANDADGTAYRTRSATILVCSNDTKLKCSNSSDCIINGVTGTCASSTNVWKLGDIISSTPKLVSNVKLNNYNFGPPTGYNDASYANFTNTATYKNRGMVFVGSNDGMLHAFKLGILKELTGAFDKAQINNSSGSLAGNSDNLGREEWAFVPKNVLPYLTYLTDPSYRHLYYVDRTSSIADVSIGVPSGCSGDYSTCTKDASTWRTVLIGGMGIGGAVKSWSDGCTAPADCVKPPISEAGFSTYFALDVTDPASPKYMWEFNGAPNSYNYLGYTTTGPAIIRISSKDVSGVPNHSKNGKWFAVFASGPTGPIDTTLQAFQGQSDQNLKIFIVDLVTGVLVKTIDTGIANAFAGSLASSWIDIDKSKSSSNGFYSDDAVYIGYVQKDTSVTPNTWTKGGVIRLFTKESDDPGSADATKQWAFSTLISGTGPVTTSVTKLQDRLNGTLWIYFGTGRYFFKSDDGTNGTIQKIYGVKEPCYLNTSNTFDLACTTSVTTTETTSCKTVLGTATGLCDQTGDAATEPAAKLDNTMSGWVIKLDAASSGSFTERVITDPVASPAGAVFFTTFKPSADVCKFGGDSLLWAVNYASGGIPPAVTMQGKALMQVSTGAFAEINLAEAFKHPSDKGKDGRQLTTPISGVPPTSQGLSLITNPPPVKKFLHIREK